MKILIMPNSSDTGKFSFSYLPLRPLDIALSLLSFKDLPPHKNERFMKPPSLKTILKFEDLSR